MANGTLRMTNLSMLGQDDALLRRLSVEPPRPLLPVLQHSDAMASLAVFFAFIPTLYALSHRTLSDDGAGQGLLSLLCYHAQTVAEFIDPLSVASPPPVVHQPVLMNWLTALCMRMFGPDSDLGLETSGYLCTAALILAIYVVARRFGGESLGLCATLLAAFNPHILRLAQEPLPQSAATLFAVLAIAGAIAHWQKSPSVASTQLLLGGIALALCLLAGGPVALLVVLLLLIYASLWKLDDWRSRNPETPPDRNPLSRKQAIRGVLILAATGFAGGGWRPLWLGSHYGADFWRGWLGLPAAGSAVSKAPGGWQLLLRVDDLVAPLGVLSILGLGLIVAEIVKRREGPGRHHRGLLLVWTAVVAPAWLWADAGTGDAWFAAECWKILLVVPLLISAAFAVVGILERRVPFGLAIATGWATLVEIAIFASRGDTALPLEGQGASLPAAAPSSALAAGAVLLLAGVTVIFCGRTGEARQRVLLSLLLLGSVGATCLRGALEVRRAASPDVELADVHAALSRIQDVQRVVLVDLPGSDDELPDLPPTLWFLLKSLWHAAEVNQYPSWEAAARHVSETEGPAPVFVTWSPRERVALPVSASGLRPLTAGLAYRGCTIAAYALRDKSLLLDREAE